jgi:hypothetical protein
MNDSQLIERLAETDLYRNDRPLPETMRPDIGLLEIARRSDMDTMERVQTVKPPRQRRNGPLVAAAAFALVVIIGLVGALLTSPNEGTEPANPTTTTVPATTTAPPQTTVAPEPIDIGAVAPTQVQNDQASRATLEFAGNARALVEGGAHVLEIQMYIEADSNDPGVTVTLSSIDGEITSTGLTDNGIEFEPTWSWTPDGDKVVVTMVPRGAGIPDTRPAVVVTIQETASSDPVEFVLTAEAGAGRPG